MTEVGITERGDAALDDSWVPWVYEKNLPAILITKNAPLLEQNHPDIFSKNVIIHATCTGLGETIFEPNVHSSNIFAWLRELPKEYLSKIVLRVDPICIPLLAYDKDIAVPKETTIKTENKDHTYIPSRLYMSLLQLYFDIAVELGLRVRISFMDLYGHVLARFLDKPDLYNFLKDSYKGDLHYPLEDRLEFLNLIKTDFPSIDFEVCGEPGIPCTGCVSVKDLKILNVYNPDEVIPFGEQRPACCCLAAKKELLDNKHPCGHNCIYCYWKKVEEK